MHRDDLVSQVRIRARLDGRNQARRVITAVLEALRPLVAEDAFARIAAQLPDGLTAGAGPAVSGPLIASVARRLHVDTANAAFLSRIVFAQLNDYCQGVTPASLAPSAPAAVRPLLSARAEDPVRRFREWLPLVSSGTLSLRVQTTPVTGLIATLAPVRRARPATSDAGRDRPHL